MTVLDATESTYRILVSRGVHEVSPLENRRPNADLYAFGLRDAIPAFPIPLRPNDSEPVVDLQRLLNEVYRRARFDLAIDYTQPLKPALSNQDATWVREILQSTHDCL